MVFNKNYHWMNSQQIQAGKAVTNQEKNHLKILDL
jgi:hypothetical protein